MRFRKQLTEHVKLLARLKRQWRVLPGADNLPRASGLTTVQFLAIHYGIRYEQSYIAGVNG